MKTGNRFFKLAVCAVILIGLSLTVTSQRRSGTPGKVAPPRSRSSATDSERTGIQVAGQPEVITAYGKLPLSFEENRGQSDPRVRFVSRGHGYGVFLTSTEAILTLPQTSAKTQSDAPLSRSRTADWLQRGDTKHNAAPQRLMAVRVGLVGANAAPRMTGLDQLPGKANYFLGNDPKKWHTNVPTYARVKYQNVYPGVDLIYYGNQQDLESDFVLAPGADPATIRLKFRGTKSVEINSDGDLLLKTIGGGTTLHRPVAYQSDTGGAPLASDADKHDKHFVPARYVLKNAGEVAFAVESYDTREPLIIDPVLTYSTYLAGSSGNDSGYGIAMDAAGDAYVTGQTSSTDFPLANPFQSTCKSDGGCGAFCAGSGSACGNAFVAKLNPAGNALVYSTYLGGSGEDHGFGIAVDAAGNAYVAGWTDSIDFPTANAFQTACAPPTAACSNAFVTKLNPAGDALVYSTYLGGSRSNNVTGTGATSGTAIAVDAVGNAYVTGDTSSTDFPTVNSFQKTCATSSAGCADAFVTKFNATGNVVYSTYLGGNSLDFAFAIAVDAAGSAYVTGYTESTNFPLKNPFQSTCGALSNFFGTCAFVTKFDVTGSVVYSTYLGGSVAPDGPVNIGTGIAIDATGNAYVTGSTSTTDFPTANAFQASLPNSAQSAFVTKFNPAGNALVYSTYLGGNTGEYAAGIAVDASGNAYLIGVTASSNFPLVNPIQNSCPVCTGPPIGAGFAFLTELGPAGNSLLYSTYLGGSSPNHTSYGRSIAVDSGGNAYGLVEAFTGFPITPGAFQVAFVVPNGSLPSAPAIVKISGNDAPGFAAGPATLDFLNQVNTSASQTITLYDSGSQPLTITNMAINGTDAADFSSTTNCLATVAGGGNCTVNVTFSPQTLGTKSVDLVVTDDAAGSPHAIPITGISATPPTVALSPTSLTFGSVPVGSSSSPQTITLTNAGGAPLQISSLSLTAGFGLQNTSCSGTVNGAGSCWYAVVFVPQITGPVTGALSFTDNASDSPQAVALSGTGTPPPPPDFTLSALPSNISTQRGMQVSSTITLNGQNGFSGSVTLNCAATGPAPLPTCKVSPSPVMVGSTHSTSTLTITAPSSSSALALPKGDSAGRTLYAAFLPLPALFTLLGAIARKSRKPRSLWLLGGSIVLFALLAGCGGGSNTTTTPPPQNYTVTVTATSGSLQHSTNVALTVQ